ncbi:MAG: hypothetical protein GY765_43975 [bacterium]|nr:hypothetical protein [bacterium]
MEKGRLKTLVWLILLTIPVVMWAADEKESEYKELKCVKIFPAEDEEDVWFKSPAVIDVDDDGNVYAFDPNNHHFIYKMDAKCKRQTAFKNRQER